jgi:hypothetical protein
MDADALARVRGNIRRAFAASVYVTLLEHTPSSPSLFEFTSHYLVDHVITITWRGADRWIISARKANARQRKTYYARVE